MIQRGISALILITAGIGYSQTAWTKYEYNPVMTKDTTLAGIWEWAAIGQPTCILENDTIKMYYAAAGIAYIGDTIFRGRISYAYSTNGIDWIKRDPPVPVLNVGPPGAWDSRWLDTPAIVRDNDGYKLYYYGDSLSVVYSAIGMATSTDGINWTKDPTNPVLDKGELMGWDGFWVESPAVLYNSASGLYEMWFTGVGYGPGLPSDLRISIGRATSVDGSIWIKDSLHNPVLDTGAPGSFDDGWVSVPGVRKTGGLYEMWYVGASVADYAADSTLDTSRVGYATSTDGINWVKYAGNPVLSTFDPPVDTGGPWAPDVVFDNTAYQMLYEAADGIGLASAPAGLISENRSGASLRAVVSPTIFSRSITIRWPLTLSSNINAAIYNSSGQKVKRFVFDAAKPFIWHGEDDAGAMLPSGIYFVTLRNADMSTSAKCILVR